MANEYKKIRRDDKKQRELTFSVLCLSNERVIILSHTKQIGFIQQKKKHYKIVTC